VKNVTYSSNQTKYFRINNYSNTTHKQKKWFLNPLTLLFKRQFIKLIRDGTKTQTRRLKPPKVKIGKTYYLKQSYRGHLQDKILILDVFQQTLGSLTEKDACNEGFSSILDFNQAWTDIYGSYDPHAYIWVVEFQYIGTTDTFKQKSSG
jgi:hypothetical protein